MNETRAKVRFPRRIRPGARPSVNPGAVLSCLVLSAGEDEWIGVDLGSGALLRSHRGAAEGLRAAEAPDGERRLVRFDVVSVELGVDDAPVDPSRPEAVVVTGAPTYLGRPSRRRVRRLLAQLAAPERQGSSLLSTWGPSIAYVDLDGSIQSVTVVKTSPGQIALEEGGRGAVAVVTWSGTTQAVPISDPLARRALASGDGRLTKGSLVEALGFRPSYLVCALAEVREGHAPKVVLAVLPSRMPIRLGRRLLRKRAGGEVLGHRPAEGDEGVPT